MPRSCCSISTKSENTANANHGKNRLRDMYQLKIRSSASFTSSLGCTLVPPMLIQLVAPFCSVPMARGRASNAAAPSMTTLIRNPQRRT